MTRIVAVLLAIVGALLSSPAEGQVACGPHDAITPQLLAQFAEVPVGLGLTNDGLLLELYASPDGTWTALISNPAGVSCIVSFGVGWQSKGPSAVKENAPPMEPGD